MQYSARPLESLTGYTLEQGSGKLANLSGIFQRKGSSAKRCDKTALLPYITPDWLSDSWEREQREKETSEGEQRCASKPRADLQWV